MNEKKSKEERGDGKTKRFVLLPFWQHLKGKAKGKSRRHSPRAELLDLKDDERYEYVVEKLAVRRIPVSLFTIDQDAMDEEKSRRTKTSAATMAPSSKSSFFRRKKRADSVDSEAKFSLYYETVPKVDIEAASRTPAPKEETSAISLLDVQKFEEEAPPRVVYPPKKAIISKDRETEIVCHILNQCSSLYTSAVKTDVPKDPQPLNPAKNAPQRLVVPSSVHKHVVSQQRPHQGTPAISSLKEMSPDLQQTITALGVAQKPKTPGFPPRNTRHISSRFDQEGGVDSTSYIMMIGSKHQLSLKSTAVSDNTPQNSCLDKNISCCSPREEVKSHKSVPGPNNVDEACEINPNYFAAEEVEDHDPAPLLAAPASMDTFLYTQDVVTSVQPEVSEEATSTADFQQDSQTSEPKEKSLNWKIIIKHRPDKNKKECECSEDE